jgi:hypothetical protein
MHAVRKGTKNHQKVNAYEIEQIKTFEIGGG